MQAKRGICKVEVQEWEYRQDSLNGEEFVVYKICMSDYEGEWIVYRRYSDFPAFDAQVRKLLPNFQYTLPGKEYIRPFLDYIRKAPLSKRILGKVTEVDKAEGDEEKGRSTEVGRVHDINFLNERLRKLDLYLKEILVTAGEDRVSFWNNPAVLTFFDIPRLLRTNPRPSSTYGSLPSTNYHNEINNNNIRVIPPIPPQMWDSQLKIVKEQLEESASLKDRMKKAASRGMDTSTQSRHVKRQRNSLFKSLEKLQSSLDIYAKGPLPESDSHLEEMSQGFQEVSYMALQIFPDLYSLNSPSSVSEKSTSHSTIINSSFPSQIEPNQRVPKSDPIAKTPVRSSSLSIAPKSTFNEQTFSTPPRRESSLDVIGETMAEQDRRLNEVSSHLQRHKNLGLEMNNEIEITSRLAEEMKDLISLDQGKMKNARDRMNNL